MFSTNTEITNIAVINNQSIQANLERDNPATTPTSSYYEIIYPRQKVVYLSILQVYLVYTESQAVYMNFTFTCHL